MPYFEGDFWPNVIEESIKELEQEEEEKRKAEASAVAAAEAAARTAAAAPDAVGEGEDSMDVSECASTDLSILNIIPLYST